MLYIYICYVYINLKHIFLKILNNIHARTFILYIYVCLLYIKHIIIKDKVGYRQLIYRVISLRNII